MPGVVSSVSVKVGQAVNAGDVLMTLESMKMETVLHASRDATIVDIPVMPRSQVDSKDLLIEMI
jgi:pyruvate carboxylase